MAKVNKTNYNLTGEYDYLVKCLIVGDSGIGKSAMMCRFSDDVYSPEYISTIGVDFKIRTIEHRNKTLKLQIWDTAGQERFRAITSSYYRGSHAIIICYDTTDTETFTNVEKWLGEVKKYSSKSPILVLCGTKSDLTFKRQVSESEGFEYAKLNNMMFIETSAKNGTNVSELFKLIGSTVIDKHTFEDVDIGPTTNINVQPSTTQNFCNC